MSAERESASRGHRWVPFIGGRAPSAILLGCILVLPAVLGACSSAVESATVWEQSEGLREDGTILRDGECVSTVGDGLPDDLRCTGLYSNWQRQTIDRAAVAYTPGFELWSDGAKKQRFILLPPGTKIDARDMNAWVFPVGTKLWKEFRLPIAGSGTPLVETRMMEKTAPGTWAFATYVWSADQRSATRVRSGIMPFPGTANYEVPKERACLQCHRGRRDRVLGFEAVLLAAPEARGLTYANLSARGLLDTGKTPPPAAAALGIPGSPIERDAIGRLHANCGISCHSPTGSAPFSMRIDIVDGATPRGVEQTSVFAEAIGQPSSFSPEGGMGNYDRIRPTDPERSTVFYRLSKRDAPGGFEQMPPLATHVVDSALVESVGAWVRSMTASPYPAPSPP
jgi:hypothetical protein